MTNRFGVLNLIVGIFCENAMKTAAQNETEWLKNRDAKRRKVLNHLRESFLKMDMDGSGDISREEFLHSISTDERVMDAFEELGVSEEENLFDILDADRQG